MRRVTDPYVFQVLEDSILLSCFPIILIHEWNFQVQFPKFVEKRMAQMVSTLEIVWVSYKTVLAVLGLAAPGAYSAHDKTSITRVNDAPINRTAPGENAVSVTDVRHLCATDHAPVLTKAFEERKYEPEDFGARKTKCLLVHTLSHAIQDVHIHHHFSQHPVVLYFTSFSWRHQKTASPCTERVSPMARILGPNFITRSKWAQVLVSAGQDSYFHHFTRSNARAKADHAHVTWSAANPVHSTRRSWWAQGSWQAVSQHLCRD